MSVRDIEAVLAEIDALETTTTAAEDGGPPRAGGPARVPSSAGPDLAHSLVKQGRGAGKQIQRSGRQVARKSGPSAGGGARARGKTARSTPAPAPAAPPAPPPAAAPATPARPSSPVPVAGPRAGRAAPPDAAVAASAPARQPAPRRKAKVKLQAMPSETFVPESARERMLLAYIKRLRLEVAAKESSYDQLRVHVGSKLARSNQEVKELKASLVVLRRNGRSMAREHNALRKKYDQLVEARELQQRGYGDLRLAYSRDSRQVRELLSQTVGTLQRGMAALGRRP